MGKESILQYIELDPTPCADGRPDYSEPCASRVVQEQVIRDLENRHVDLDKIEKTQTADLPSGDSKVAKSFRASATVHRCSTEICVIESVLDDKKEIRHEIAVRFKEIGPRDSLQWLTNTMIDNTLAAWAGKYKYFFNYDFSMRDFDDHNYPMKKFPPGEVIKSDKHPQRIKENGEFKLIHRQNNCAGGVMNTDVHAGRGIHWVAFFIDARGTGKPTIEYFNSSGNPPPKEVVRWMDRNPDFKSIIVTNIAHQKFDTECGMYSLCFIRHRLEGKSYEFYRNNTVPDKDMEEFRKYVFSKR